MKEYLVLLTVHVYTETGRGAFAVLPMCSWWRLPRRRRRVFEPLRTWLMLFARSCIGSSKTVRARQVGPAVERNFFLRGALDVSCACLVSVTIVA